MSQSIFLICYDFIKNNSYINLDDGNHIRLLDPVVMQYNHTMSRIFHKILANGRPVAKTLLKYNSNRLEENDEEENESINIEFTEQNRTL